MAVPSTGRWRIINYSYVLLALVCLGLGSAILVGMIATRLYLGIPIVLALFFASSFRILYLGYKRISFDGILLEVSAPFWFRSCVAISEIDQCEAVRTDSIKVEEEAGRGFAHHQPTLAKTYAVARALVGLARWMNRFQIGSAVATAAPLLALRFWFKDGTRSELLLPDHAKTTAELKA